MHESESSSSHSVLESKSSHKSLNLAHESRTRVLQHCPQSVVSLTRYRLLEICSDVCFGRSAEGAATGGYLGYIHGTGTVQACLRGGLLN